MDPIILLSMVIILAVLGAGYYHFSNLKDGCKKLNKSCESNDECCDSLLCTTSKCSNPKDCVGSWGDWSDCDAECESLGKQYSDFIITTTAEPGGKCPQKNTKKTKSCSGEPCPTDCSGRWGEWRECSKQCDGVLERIDQGIMTKTYYLTQRASNGGEECEIEEGTTITRLCNVGVVCPTCKDWYETNNGESATDTELCGSDALKYNTEADDIFGNDSATCCIPKKYCKEWYIDNNGGSATDTELCGSDALKYNTEADDIFGNDSATCCIPKTCQEWFSIEGNVCNNQYIPLDGNVEGVNHEECCELSKCKDYFDNYQHTDTSGTFLQNGCNNLRPIPEDREKIGNSFQTCCRNGYCSDWLYDNNCPNGSLPYTDMDKRLTAQELLDATDECCDIPTCGDWFENNSCDDENQIPKDESLQFPDSDTCCYNLTEEQKNKTCSDKFNEDPDFCQTVLYAPSGAYPRYVTDNMSVNFADDKLSYIFENSQQENPVIDPESIGRCCLNTTCGDWYGEGGGCPFSSYPSAQEAENPRFGDLRYFYKQTPLDESHELAQNELWVDGCCEQSETPYTTCGFIKDWFIGNPDYTYDGFDFCLDDWLVLWNAYTNTGYDESKNSHSIALITEGGSIIPDDRVDSISSRELQKCCGPDGEWNDGYDYQYR